MLGVAGPDTLSCAGRRHKKHALVGQGMGAGPIVARLDFRLQWRDEGSRAGRPNREIYEEKPLLSVPCATLTEKGHNWASRRKRATARCAHVRRRIPDYFPHKLLES